MNEKTKKFVFLIGAIMIAVIFITSYAAFSNNNTANATTSTVSAAPQQTVFASATTNGIITNYTQIAYVESANSSNSSGAKLGQIMSQLEANSSIYSYIYVNDSYEAYLSNVSAYDLQELLYKDFNSTNAISIGSTADILLPSSISMYYSNSSPPISVPLSNRNYTVYITGLKSIGSSLNLSVSALITTRGTIYNNQLRIALDH